MNAEQIKSIARWFGATAAGGILIQKLGLSLDQIPGVVDAIIALATAALAVWGYLAHSEKAVVIAAQSMPNVAGVVTTNTLAGAALAESVPSEAVQSAGTTAAVNIARTPGPKKDNS